MNVSAGSATHVPIRNAITKCLARLQAHFGQGEASVHRFIGCEWIGGIASVYETSVATVA
jgi:hypothetical protein